MWVNEFLRYLVLLVFRILLHVFFNDVEVVGRLNVPRKGPVIFVGTECGRRDHGDDNAEPVRAGRETDVWWWCAVAGNHRNQFVDAMIMFCR